ncbi:Mediator of RNA polymerase II transcription subunit 7 [Coemansia sp. RSA 552]|nr:Mediator of RNA polymerase II transcription subunit 7 [Coemansia sp. RSA 552]
MQDPSQQGAGQHLDASYPAPPDYFTRFTDANLQRLASVGEEAAAGDSELGYLLPPQLPKDAETYSVFGRVWQVRDRLPSLSEQNIPQLYPEGPIDRVTELKRLNHSVIFEFLGLVDVLIKDPSQYGARTERIRDVLVNIHHLINEYREHQAKETLKLLLHQQIESKLQAADRTRAKCKELEQTIERLQREAAATKAELDEAAAGQRERQRHEAEGSKAAWQVAEAGLAKIVGELEGLAA